MPVQGRAGAPNGKVAKRPAEAAFTCALDYETIIGSRMRLAALVLLFTAAPAGAVDPHYAPIENLERFDVQRLNAARKTIDMAAYVLTEWPVIGALTAAAYRGVRVRIYLDGGQAGSEAMAREGRGVNRAIFVLAGAHR